LNLLFATLRPSWPKEKQIILTESKIFRQSIGFLSYAFCFSDRHNEKKQVCEEIPSEAVGLPYSKVRLGDDWKTSGHALWKAGAEISRNLTTKCQNQGGLRGKK